MSEEVLTMSSEELKRIEVIKKIYDKHLKKKEAALILNCSTKTIGRYCKRYRKSGEKGLISSKRGMPSNNKFTNDFKNQAVSIIANKYIDFGPTLAAEKLLERDNLKVSKETIRNWMIEAGIWRAKTKKISIHQPRERRANYGSLIQIDGSPHDWFEGRSDKCCLIVFVDDATSKIQLMRFFPVESTFAYFNVMSTYIKRYGLPHALYSDKHSVFRVNQKEAESGTGFTQFGRAMETLGVDLIYANSPQAKGKVERKNRSLQDRLVKEMRLDGINNIEMANDEYLDNFTEKYNNKFSSLPCSTEDLHTPVKNIENLELHFTLQESRKISKSLTISYKGVIYKIKEPDKTRRLYQAQVVVCEAESGMITILYKGQPLNYELYNKKDYPKEALSSKELPSKIKLSLKSNKAHVPAADHPWRKKWEKDRCA